MAGKDILPECAVSVRAPLVSAQVNGEGGSGANGVYRGDRDLADVGEVSRFSPGRFEIVEVGSRQIGVLRWRDSFYAIENACPHLRGPVCQGTVHAALTSDSAGVQLALDGTAPVVACAWHGWEFRLSDGTGVVDRRLRLRMHEVSVVEGHVLVRLQRSPNEERHDEAEGKGSND